MLHSEEDVIKLIRNDKWMMDVLKVVQMLDLPDWWVCAGFIRSKVWDTLHGFKHRTNTPDIDVIYFEERNIDEKKEKELENQLHLLMPGLPWSVKNQARMHVINKISPYQSSVDAISKFPETATALGVRLNSTNALVLAAPCGIEDVINLQVKPTAFFMKTAERAAIYENRLHKKKWKSVWNNIEITYISEKKLGRL